MRKTCTFDNGSGYAEAIDSGAAVLDDTHVNPNSIRSALADKYHNANAVLRD